jgi:chromodomain-helicase-DNA-binding protein 4
LNFLRKAWHKGNNVILADEMGLGKTISAIAYVESLLREMRAGLPSLVVVPLSTLPNWVSEFKFWAQGTNAVVLYGPAGARQVSWDAANVHQMFPKWVRNVS